AAWLDFLGIPFPDPNQVEVIDSNVSTVTAEADKVMSIGGPQPRIVHAEILAGRDLTLPERAHWYNTLLRRRHRVPVWTTGGLLLPGADGPELPGSTRSRSRARAARSGSRMMSSGSGNCRRNVS